MRAEGACDARFAGVRDVFEAAFAAGQEIGAAVSVTLDGETVVDLWGGHADPARTRAWQADTLTNVYSTTKGMAALCLLQLAGQGKVDLDAPVASVWPEFAAAGKRDLPIRMLLGHRAGLPAVAELLPPEALYDWHTMTTALAAQAPWWTPGEKHGYHAVTFGWLVGEVVRRVSGARSLGAYFREHFAGPLGLDFHIGLAESEHARCAEMSAMALPTPDSPDAEEGLFLAKEMMGNPTGMTARAFMNPPSMAAGPNVAAWRSAEIPGANGHGTARDLARIYGAVALDDGAWLDRDAVALAHTELSHGPDAVLGVSTRFGHGFMLSMERADTKLGPNPHSFGHPGAGGSLGFADPDARLGFGYVMNRMGPRILLDDRAIALLEATYTALG